MKNIIFLLISTFFLNISQAQIKKITHKEDNIDLRKIAFNTNWDTISRYFQELSIDEKENFLKKNVKNTLIDDSNFAYKYIKNNPSIEGIEFDEMFLLFGNIMGINYSSFSFYKNLRSKDEIEKFYASTNKQLTKKYGKTFWGNLKNEKSWRKNEYLIKSEKIHDTIFVLRINKVFFGKSKPMYRNYKYTLTSELFKEIDKTKTFNGYQIDTKIIDNSILNEIKKFNSSAYILKNIDTKKIIWNNIIFSESMYELSKQNTLSNIKLYYDCKSELDFNNFKTQIFYLLGKPTSEENENFEWEGYNLRIFFPKLYSNFDKRIKLEITTELNNTM